MVVREICEPDVSRNVACVCRFLGLGHLTVWQSLLLNRELRSTRSVMNHPGAGCRADV